MKNVAEGGTTARALNARSALRRRAPFTGTLLAALAVGALASAPAALATGTDYQWTGGGALPSWAQTDNWQPSGFPAGPIGTLSFPDLGTTCDNGSSSNTCYSSDDELGNLTADQLSIDDDQAYSIYTTGASTLTLNSGLTATPTESTADSMTGDPILDVPINLGSNQSWTIDGGMHGGGYGIVVPQITGNYGLQLGFVNYGVVVASQIENSSLNITDGGDLVLAALPSGTGQMLEPELPSGGTQLYYSVSLYVTAPTTGGPLTTLGFPSSPTTISIESGEAPDAALRLSGNVAFDPNTVLSVELDDNDTVPADGGYSQLTTTGAYGINLAGATLNLDQGLEDANGNCTMLKAGDAFPVIQAGGALSGNLTYVDSSNNFDTLAPGQTSKPMSVTLPAGCSSGAPSSAATATLTYGAQSITATILGAPQSTQAPAITGMPQVGQTLTMSSNGSWSGYPTATYTYQWLACTTSCSPISGANGSTLTLTSAQLGDTIKLQATATNSQGAASTSSNTLGPVTAAPVAGPTAAQITTALDKIGHPSGTKAIKALIKTGKFKASFAAPAAGSLSITWTTRVTTGKGKHKKHKTITIATGSGHPGGSGALTVTIHLTAAGRSLLKEKQHGVAVAATAKFEPNGDSWTSVTKHFSL